MSYNFSYLSRTLEDWYEEKSQEHGQSFIHTENPIEYLLSEHQDLYKKLDMSQKRFEKVFLKPYYDLIDKGCFDFETMKSITGVLSQIVGKTVIIQRDLHVEPFSLTIETTQDRYAKALDWVCVQIMELNLQGLELPENVYDLVDEPVLQCRYCGKLDTDAKGREFNRKRKYCHSLKCTESKSVNPEHHIGCCFGEWARKKKLLVQALKRHYKGKEKGKEYFERTCNELYEHALTLSEPVRTHQTLLRELLASLPTKDEIQREEARQLFKKYDGISLHQILKALRQGDHV
ncbi:MAG TPA: hypothetical protein VIG33_02475 [Pseudobdellovibrionaceae bacterium]|jgi:hypothetical protein